ncbi:NAD-dependent epimerase/dehydratase family protein [Bdellovibrio svalbardensis]|uniref:NAD-dependent epimerase/dehydratase family protein n=1 Tax=Bdellovibrio svalbardensis TaxID=2972972 RepID=A0ABT6DJB5_9BACT|nr:NAD-dependent epimerase/dehydratase family protein [Bdellovibrio svalbardensis]MDG0816953.1 NAD-dependent epimerase/dehydratase family protein [Bdellovibrio svalbardensis]
MRVLVLGGTRYFGKRLVQNLLQEGSEVWTLSRGLMADGFGAKVHRLIADRNDKQAVIRSIGDLQFDAVVDQICMTSQQAEDAIQIFKGKTDYYLMTSTVSVYDFGADLKEEAVDPRAYQARVPTNPMEEYGEGKRAAESVLATRAPFRAGFARFPVVLGEDDYTRRLHEQIIRVKQGTPIYYPNLDAHFSFITSADAAKSLLWLLKNKKSGPYNFAAQDPIQMKDLIKMIEETVGMKANLLNEPSEKDWSPFGISQDWYVNVEKAAREGFHAEPIAQWLQPLINQLDKEV